MIKKEVQDTLKKDFLIAYEKGLSIKNSAAIIKVDNGTIYNWVKSDLDFAASLAKIKNEKSAYILGKLFALLEIDNPNPQVVIRALNSILFKDSEWKLMKDKDYVDDKSAENEEYTLEIK